MNNVDLNNIQYGDDKNLDHDEFDGVIKRYTTEQIILSKQSSLVPRLDTTQERFAAT
jgi:hypothetical protein